MGIGLEARLDPFVLATKLGIRIVSPETVAGLSKDTLLVLKSGNYWSGGAINGPLGEAGLIVLNPTDSMLRKNVTLMEEICHLLLRHKASLRGFRFGSYRVYASTIEQQAYGIGAAALVPYSSLYEKMSSKLSVAEISNQYSVTQSLALYRIKGLGLAPSLS